MKNFNQAKTNIQITSYENGEPFTTEHIVFGEISFRKVCCSGAFSSIIRYSVRSGAS